MAESHLQAVDQTKKVMFGAVSGLNVLPESIGKAEGSVDATEDGDWICHGAGSTLVDWLRCSLLFGIQVKGLQGGGVE